MPYQGCKVAAVRMGCWEGEWNHLISIVQGLTKGDCVAQGAISQCKMQWERGA